MEFKGTKGKWTAKKNNAFYEVGTSAEGKRLGFNIMLFAIGDRTLDLSHSEENKANAQLIAAAPELLEALQMILKSDQTDGSWDHQASCDYARKAINKALGL